MSCLIVDESLDERDSCTSYLTRHGFKIRQAEDGVTALAMCREEMPDLIVVGSKTSKMSGIQFLRKLRRSRAGQSPVVLYCASGEDAGQLGFAIARGASECLMKPYDADLLDFKLQQSGLI